MRNGNYHTLDPASIVENGLLLKFFKKIDVKTNSDSISLPSIPSNGWRVFPSQNIPSLFNYGHVHYYASF